jgi:hypothetical protein
MNKKTKQSTKVERGSCLCQGTGPALSELLRRIGPPEQARQHFDAARVEFLKGLRAFIDARIEKLSKANAKGKKIDVE